MLINSNGHNPRGNTEEKLQVAKVLEEAAL